MESGKSTKRMTAVQQSVLQVKSLSISSCCIGLIVLDRDLLPLSGSNLTDEGSCTDKLDLMYRNVKVLMKECFKTCLAGIMLMACAQGFLSTMR